MQHARRMHSPEPPRDIRHDHYTPDEAMAHIRKKYPKLKQDQIETINEHMMYYAHGTPNGVTRHVMDHLEHHARRYHEMNTGRHKLPYNQTSHKGRTE